MFCYGENAALAAGFLLRVANSVAVPSNGFSPIGRGKMSSHDFDAPVNIVFIWASAHQTPPLLEALLKVLGCALSLTSQLYFYI